MSSILAHEAVCGPKYFIPWLLSSEGISHTAAIIRGTNVSSHLDGNVDVFVPRNAYVPGKSKTKIPRGVSHIL